MLGSAVGRAAGDHRAIGQIEGYFVLNGAVGGLLELVEGANDFEILNDLVALGLDHAIFAALYLAVRIVRIHGRRILVDHHTGVDGGAVGHRAEFSLRVGIVDAIFKQIELCDVANQCVLTAHIIDFGIAGHKYDFEESFVGVVVGQVFVGFEIDPKGLFSIEGFAGALNQATQEFLFGDEQTVGFTHVVNGIAQ